MNESFNRAMNNFREEIHQNTLRQQLPWLSSNPATENTATIENTATTVKTNPISTYKKINYQQLINLFLYYNWDRLAKYREELYFFKWFYFELFTLDIFFEYVSRIPVETPISDSSIKKAYRIICNRSYPVAMGTNYIEQWVAFQNCALRMSDGQCYNRSNYLSLSYPQISWISDKEQIPLNYIFTTSYIKANYSQDSDSTCPEFDKFLAAISGNDQELINRIWEIIGYYLTPDMSMKCFVVFQGVGNSGKSVLAEFIRSLFNDEATISLGIEDFRNAGYGHLLFGRRLATCMELSETAISLNVVRGVKAATGNDILTVKTKSFRNQCKLLFGSNYPLVTKSHSKEFYDRFVSVPFRYSIPPDQQDPQLLARISLEKDAVVSQAIKAYYRLRANGYHFSGNFVPNDPSLFPETDPEGYGVLCFLKQYCVFCAFDEGKMTTEALYAAFMESEYAVPDTSQLQFGKQLAQILKSVYPGKTIRAHWYESCGPTQEKQYRWGRKGIRLKKPDSERDACTVDTSSISSNTEPVLPQHPTQTKTFNV